jgi:hypothetical protein
VKVYTIEVALEDLGITGTATLRVAAVSRTNAERAARDTFNVESMQLNIINEEPHG